MTNKRALIVLGLLLLVVAGTAAVPSLRGMAGLTESSSVPVYQVESRDFVRRIDAEGNLKAATATPLGPPPSRHGPFKIAWLAQDGSQVEDGEVVIRFDPTEMEDNLAKGESERAKTDSRIIQKKVREEGSLRNLERDTELAELELGYASEFQSKDPVIFSRVEIIESEIDRDLANERKDSADLVRGVKEELVEVELDLLAIERRKSELQIQEAQEGLQKLEVQAPHEGIFTLKQVWGRLPEVGSMVWGGNQLAEIPRLDVMEAEVFVLEADAGGLEEGVRASVRLDAHPDRVYEAKVKKVDALAKPRFRKVPVQYFRVVLELERTDPEVMKPGTRVSATLVLGERENALIVPRQAVFDKDGASVVYVRRGGRFEPVKVELGPAGLGTVVVEKGLDESDSIALRDPTRPLMEASPAGGGESTPAAPGARASS